MGKQQRKLGNPPTRAQAFPIKIENPLKESILKKFPAFSTLGDFDAIPDINFTKSKTGVGDIEYFSAEQDTITYPNGFKVAHPSPGRKVVLYNPRTNNQQSIALDLLHGLPQADETYKNLKNNFSEAVLDRHGGDYRKALEAEGAPDGERQFKSNYIDGKIRNLLFKGTADEFKKNRYNPGERKFLFEDPAIKESFNQLSDHLKGTRKVSKKAIKTLKQGGPMKNSTSYQEGGPLLPSKRIGHYGRGGRIALGTAKGALGGAASGAAIGSVVPVIGTAIGAVGGAIIGGLKGFFGSRNAEDANEESLALAAKSKKDAISMNNLALDKSALAVFPTKGVETAPFGLKDGGPAPATLRAIHGGRLKPLTNGVLIAKGRSHAQGGIKGDTDFDGQADVELEDNELFFPDVGENGFVVNKEISRRFIPQFRKIKGNSRVDIRTRNLLIDRAVTENEERKESLKRPTSAEVYGDRTPPSRKALFSETHPDRKTQNQNKATFVGNPAWRKQLHSLQNPDRKIKTRP